LLLYHSTTVNVNVNRHIQLLQPHQVRSFSTEFSEKQGVF